MMNQMPWAREGAHISRVSNTSQCLPNPTQITQIWILGVKWLWTIVHWCSLTHTTNVPKSRVPSIFRWGLTLSGISKDQWLWQMLTIPVACCFLRPCTLPLLVRLKEIPYECSHRLMLSSAKGDPCELFAETEIAHSHTPSGENFEILLHFHSSISIDHNDYQPYVPSGEAWGFSCISNDQLLWQIMMTTTITTAHCFLELHILMPPLVRFNNCFISP